MLELKTKSSRFQINPLDGQWKGLWFTSPEDQKEISVVRGHRENEPFFSSGSFLMFPWVNRLTENPFEKAPFYPSKYWLTDAQGISLHGLYHQLERLIRNESRSVDSSELVLELKKPKEWEGTRLGSIDIKEKFLLKHNSLQITYEVSNQSEEDFAFSLGIHPYFQWEDDTSIDDLKLFGSGFYEISLDKNLLPDRKKTDTIVYQEETSLEGKTLDILLQNAQPQDKLPFVGYFSISRKERVRIQGDQSVDFFQIYTSPDRKSIAIEPMTSSGNFLTYPDARPIRIRRGESVFVNFFVIFEHF